MPRSTRRFNCLSVMSQPSACARVTTPSWRSAILRRILSASDTTAPSLGWGRALEPWSIAPTKNVTCGRYGSSVSRTVSVFRACAGGYVGDGHVHPALLDAVREAVAEAKEANLITDGYVARCGDDIGVVLLHGESIGSESIHLLASDAFDRAASVGRRLHQHGLNGAPPDVDAAEISLNVRDSEPVLCFFADKAGPGSWNVHLYRMFGDPFNTPALVSDDAMSRGFRFYANGTQSGSFDLPGDLYRFLGVAGRPGCCVREGGRARSSRCRRTATRRRARSDAPSASVSRSRRTDSSAPATFSETRRSTMRADRRLPPRTTSEDTAPSRRPANRRVATKQPGGGRTVVPRAPFRPGRIGDRSPRSGPCSATPGSP
jgi:hypothetical protein